MGDRDGEVSGFETVDAPHMGLRRRHDTRSAVHGGGVMSVLWRRQQRRGKGNPTLSTENHEREKQEGEGNNHSGQATSGNSGGTRVSGHRNGGQQP
ncbi:hypothetical protein Hdeb2414_s0010g00339901 [Helianthus debilis subsp. tardiflorus]